jgi:hypothetical protein
MRRIEADSETLLRQASMTASEYLDRAVESIDTLLGAGYAKQHPELIGAFMQAAAIDLGTAVIAGAIEEVAESLDAITHGGDEGEGLVGAIEKLAGVAKSQAMWLKYLGNGDAASTMGAIEHLAVHLGEKIEQAGTFVAEALDNRE